MNITENTEVTEFGTILLFIIGTIVFLAGGLVTAYLIRPDRPNYEKLTSYECGEEPVGTAWGKFNIRFYIIALIFILFDVEMVFLFPWATVFGQKQLIDETNGLWGYFALAEMFIFVAILVLGLAYAWVKGHLDWVKPDAKPVNFTSPVPASLYEQLNTKQYAVNRERRKAVKQ
jgi:NADH-quinone oxidoreductase subunit A